MKTRPPHTPGPWRLLSPLNGHMICDRDQLVVAVCTNGNEESNANLIAAAPELLEALSLLAQRLESLEPVHLNWHLATGEIAREARAAIAKATGEGLQ